jgi:hypothetical protein
MAIEATTSDNVVPMPVEPQGQQAIGGLPQHVDVKQSLNLRNETAFAWVMPDGWEPRHG